MPVTKVGPKYQVIIPKSAREAVGLKVGDFVEATVERKGILLRPKVVVDKAFIEKRLAEAEEDIKKGRVSRPYRSAKAFLASLHREAKRFKKNS